LGRWFCILLISGCIAAAAPITVYQNTSVQALQDVFADNPGIIGFGDQILLAAGPRELDSIETRVMSYADSVVADFRLTVYELDSFQNIGLALASQALFGVAIGANSPQSLLFTGWSITLPNEFVVMLSVQNASSLVLGLEVTGAADIGFSNINFSWWQDANGFFQKSFADSPNNYYFAVNTNADLGIPEPSTALLTAGAIFGLVALRRRP
jgi:hypothetical protein